MIQKNQAWLTLWYHCFEHNCLSTIVWMNSTLFHYLNTTCDSKLHFVVTMHLHWLELYFQLPIKTLEKHSNLETNERAETQSTCGSVRGLPSLPVPWRLKLHLLQKAKDKGPQRWGRVVFLLHSCVITKRSSIVPGFQEEDRKYFSSIGQLSMVSGDPLNGLLWPVEKISPWSCSEEILGHRAILKAHDWYKRSHGLQLLTSGLVFLLFVFFNSLWCRIFLHMYSITQQQLHSLLFELGSVVKRASQVAQWVKNPPAEQETKADVSSNLGWGRSPGGGHGNPLQYSCLENPMDRGVLWATPHRAAKSQTRLKWLSTHTRW